MKWKLMIATLLFFFGTQELVQAQTATPGVSKRQVKQTRRIKGGVKSGELTKGETKQLARQQRRIRRDKRDAKVDGVVTRKERGELRARQNSANRRIYRKKNNGNSRN